jgi:hypothetical protein
MTETNNNTNTNTNNHNISYNKDITTDIVVNCQAPILIEKLNCRIFRHGTYINTNAQIPPHSSKEDCDDLVQNNLIYGCGKPFRVIEDLQSPSQWTAIVCDYV